MSAARASVADRGRAPVAYVAGRQIDDALYRARRRLLRRVDGLLIYAICNMITIYGFSSSARRNKNTSR